MKNMGAWLGLILIGAGVGHCARSSDIKFSHLTIEDDLSQSSIFCILQDKRGFMWFGTEDGLNRYDGYKFKVYRPDPSDLNSISYNYIRAFHEDRNGALWIGTYGGGLDKFDKAKERFSHFPFIVNDPKSLSNNYINTLFESRSGELWVGTEDGLNQFNYDTGEYFRHYSIPENPQSLSSSRITSIYEDRSGELWVGTDNGLNRFESKTGSFVHYVSSGKSPLKLSSDRVTSIYEDHSGELWIGTEDGLNRLDSRRERIIHYKAIPENPQSLSHNYIYSIYEDKFNVLWIGTLSGLNRFNRETGRFEHFLSEINDPSSLSNNEILSMYEDRTGVFWIGTHIGLNKFDQERKPFIHYQTRANDPLSLSYNYVYSIHEDSSGMLWLGTYGGGLNKFNRETGQFVHYLHRPNDPGSLNNDFVRAIHEDQAGILWVGTFGGGLDKFDRKKEQFIHYRHRPDDPGSISSDFVRWILEDSQGVLWIGTTDGLNIFDRISERFIRYTHNPEDPGSLSNNFIYTLYEDHSGVLWIATIDGLNKYDRQANRFNYFRNDPGNPQSLSNSEILSLYEDSSGVLWVGTPVGLNKFDRENETFKHYMEKNGLPNNVIYSIMEDDLGNLWISTNRGLSKFNPRMDVFRNYDAKDGLQSNEFSLGAHYKRENGEMFFGGIHGVTAFYPHDIKDNPYIPPVVLTDFQIFNRSVPIESREGKNALILEKSITETMAVELSHWEKVLSFEFAALHYVSPEKNQYKYIMEGFDKDWNEVGNRRFATYTSLPHGDYTFRVIGSNNDGAWNERGISLKITVKPPFWQTLWFRLFIVLGVLFLAFVFHQVRTRNIRARNIQLEERVEERTAALQQEVIERKKLEQAAQRRLAQTALIYEVGKRVSGELDLDVLLQAVVTAICEAFNYYGVIMLMPDEQGTCLTLRSIAGDFIGTFPENLSLAWGEGMIGYAAASGETQVSGDVAKNPHFIRREREETKSELSVPIRSGEKVIGILDIQSDKYHAFDDSDVAAMEALSTQIAEAIENARLYEQAQKEIVMRKRVEGKIKAALNEKEVLLKEIHHRVKNNMQIISSLLRLQSSQVRDEETLGMFMESQDRIKSMALIHETLYQSRNLSSIHFADYLKRLTTHLISMYKEESQAASIDLQVEGVFLDINRAIPCGLIVNELITNALKHAFPEGKTGEVQIRMHCDDSGKYSLVIKDTGVGFPADLNFRETETLGLQLVSGLVSQLGGMIELKKDAGTKFIISF